MVQETSVELVIIDDDGALQSVCEQPVFGTIKDLAILPWNERFHHSQNPQVINSSNFHFEIFFLHSSSWNFMSPSGSFTDSGERRSGCNF